VADTEEKREKGLMDQTAETLKAAGVDGMVFRFATTSFRTFWNKNTLINLDLYWIQNGMVQGISPLPSITESESIVTVGSPAAVDTVVELLHK
jgi:uncharacterized membrane protein (UPF0127 family)